MVTATADLPDCVRLVSEVVTEDMESASFRSSETHD